MCPLWQSSETLAAFRTTSEPTSCTVHAGPHPPFALSLCVWLLNYWCLCIADFGLCVVPGECSSKADGGIYLTQKVGLYSSSCPHNRAAIPMDMTSALPHREDVLTHTRRSICFHLPLKLYTGRRWEQWFGLRLFMSQQWKKMVTEWAVMLENPSQKHTLLSLTCVLHWWLRLKYQIKGQTLNVG